MSASGAPATGPPVGPPRRRAPLEPRRLEEARGAKPRHSAATLQVIFDDAACRARVRPHGGSLERELRARVSAGREQLEGARADVGHGDVDEEPESPVTQSFK